MMRERLSWLVSVLEAVIPSIVTARYQAGGRDVQADLTIRGSRSRKVRSPWGRGFTRFWTASEANCGRAGSRLSMGMPRSRPSGEKRRRRNEWRTVYRGPAA